MKPEKCWKVGNKIFETYADAVKAAPAMRAELLRADIAEVLLDAGLEGFTGDADDLIDALMRVFDIKRKKRAGKPTGKTGETDG